MAREFFGDALATCCDKAVQIWKPKAQGGADYDLKTAQDVSGAQCVAWNRNNKVVAAGRDGGVIELLYSTGQAMSSLPRGGAPPGCGRLNSLSWSMGSKRLAAGASSGSVYIHDMTSKASPQP
jgi:WD40 repeat protein